MAKTAGSAPTQRPQGERGRRMGAIITTLPAMTLVLFGFAAAATATPPLPTAPDAPSDAPGPAALDPDAAEPHLRVTPAADILTEGTLAETTIRIAFTGRGPAIADPPRMIVSLGRIDEPRRTGDRTFEAHYRAPELHFPAFAIIAAEQAVASEPRPAGATRSASGSRAFVRGFATVALRAPAQPSFRTEPGARVTVQVGGEAFGPVVADHDGQARIAIVVAPGVDHARVRAVSPRGQVTSRDVDLKPPHFPHLLLMAPTVLPVGGVVELGLIGIAGDGTPIDDNHLVLRSSYLRPHPLGPKDHVARYLVRVPSRLEGGPLQLTARLRADPAPDGEDRDDLDTLTTSVPVGPGPLARLIFAARQTRLMVSGDDEWGHPVPIPGVEIYVNGQPARLEQDGSDRAIVMFDPRRPIGDGPVEVEAVLDGIYARYHLPRAALASSAPERATSAPPEAIGMGVAIGVLNRRQPGYGLEARFDLDSALPAAAQLPSCLRPGLAVGYLGTRATASDALGQSAIAIDQVALLGRLRWQWHVGGRVEAALVGGAGVAYTRVRNQIYRLHLVDRQIGPAAELGGEALARLGPGSPAIGLRYLYVPIDELGSGDVLHGARGGLVFDLGYRVGF
jgi:hypothetical protein